MPGTYGYNPPATINNYKCVRNIALWAGILGMVQALVWMALTIIGILAYSCIIEANSAVVTFGDVPGRVFYDLYFRGGDCTARAPYNSTFLTSVGTIFNPEDILIWNCVYLAVAVCWLVSSILLLTSMKKDCHKHTSAVLFTWVVFTLCICLLDLALGICFGIDYGKFHSAAFQYNFLTYQAGPVYPEAALVLAAAVTAISLCIISFKGFVLWIINAGLVGYLMCRAIAMLRDKDGTDTLFMPRKESDDILATRPPINAFYEEEKVTVAYQNDAFVPDNNRVPDAIELNQDSIARAARISTDAQLNERRFRNLEAFQQYPPARNNTRSMAGEPIVQEGIVTTTASLAAFPMPDYSPPMARANQGQNGMMRNNQRYQ